MRFVAVSCHYDVAQMAPEARLGAGHGDAAVRAEASSAAGHRIGNRPLPSTNVEFVCAASLSEQQFEKCRRAQVAYVATWREEPVAFVATLPLIGKRGYWRITRLG